MTIRQDWEDAQLEPVTEHASEATPAQGLTSRSSEAWLVGGAYAQAPMSTVFLAL